MCWAQRLSCPASTTCPSAGGLAAAPASAWGLCRHAPFQSPPPATPTRHGRSSHPEPRTLSIGPCGLNPVRDLKLPWPNAPGHARHVGVHPWPQTPRLDPFSLYPVKSLEPPQSAPWLPAGIQSQSQTLLPHPESFNMYIVQRPRQHLRSRQACVLAMGPSLSRHCPIQRGLVCMSQGLQACMCSLLQLEELWPQTVSAKNSGIKLPQPVPWLPTVVCSFLGLDSGTGLV